MTDVALKEYFERWLKDLERRVDDRFDWGEAAVREAKDAMTDRLNTMNEFRDALKDQAGRMATRAELEKLDEAVQRCIIRAEFNTLDQSVRELQRAKANLDGRLAALAAAVSVGVSLLVWALTRFVK